MNSSHISHIIKNDYELPIIEWLKFNNIGANSEKQLKLPEKYSGVQLTI